MYPRWLFSLVLLVLSSGCAFKVDVDPIDVNPVEVEPIQVVHTVQISGTALADFFKGYCEDLHKKPEDIEACYINALTTFWQAIQNSVPK